MLVIVPERVLVLVLASASASAATARASAGAGACASSNAGATALCAIPNSRNHKAPIDRDDCRGSTNAGGKQITLNREGGGHRAEPIPGS